jgi:hypothetical protein
MNRRTFGLSTIIGLFSTGIPNHILSKPQKKMKKIFVHHVYFWLTNPDAETDKQALKAGLEKLAQCKTIKNYHLGIPAATDRGVIDNTYTFSWLTIFETAADEAAYQIDPIHLAFVEENKHLWSKVIVYDSIDC